jgi:xanthine dehydrogenase accessory factor
MAFVDALYEGTTQLAGVLAKRARDVEDAAPMLSCGRAVVLTDAPLDDLLRRITPRVVVDARMRKRCVPECQREIAPVSIGLGPNFTAGENADVVIETGWGDDLGRVITSGSTRALAGDPRAIGGYTRERFIYAPAAGLFRTRFNVGDAVTQGEKLGEIERMPLLCPMSGTLRGISHDGAFVEVRTKVIEVDPSSDRDKAFGLGQRPARIADGVLAALRPL